jgi:hypothetical protein
MLIFEPATVIAQLKSLEPAKEQKKWEEAYTDRVCWYNISLLCKHAHHAFLR